MQIIRIHDRYLSKKTTIKIRIGQDVFRGERCQYDMGHQRSMNTRFNDRTCLRTLHSSAHVPGARVNFLASQATEWSSVTAMLMVSSFPPSRFLSLASVLLFKLFHSRIFTRGDASGRP